MAANAAVLTIKILTDYADAQKGTDAAAGRVSKFSSGVQKAAVPAAAALVAVGAAAISAGKAAAEDAQSQAILAQAMGKAAGASKAQVAATEDFIAKTALATGVADDQLRPAMGALVRATGDVEESQAALTAALDISAATGKDVTSVSEALAKAYAGNTSSLGRLVPGIDKAVLATGDMDKIMAELARTTEGSAAVAADTAAGRMQRMTVAMSEAQEAIGAALLPAMAKLATFLGKVAVFAAEHPGLFQAIAVAVAVMAAAIIALNIAMKIYTLTTAIMGVVSTAAWAATLGPILLVVAAVAAVVVVVILLWKKSETFRKIVIGVWNAIKTAFKVAVGFIKKHWLTMLAVMTGPIGIFALLVIRNWTKIKQFIVAVVNAIKGVWAGLMDRLKAGMNAARDVIRNAWQAIKEKAGAIVDAIKEAWRDMVQKLKDAVSGLGEILSKPFEAMKKAVDAAKSALDKVVSAIRSVIDWLAKIKLPSALTKAGDILGKVRLAPPAAARPVPLGGYAAPAVPGPGARGVTTTAAAGGVVINVTGAIDPEHTARQIRRILGGHGRRVGLTV